MISGFVPFHGDSILYSCSPWFQSAAETVPNDKWIVAWGLSVLKQELRRPSRPEGSRPRRGWRYCKCNDYCNVLQCIAMYCRPFRGSWIEQYFSHLFVAVSFFGRWKDGSDGLPMASYGPIVTHGHSHLSWGAAAKHLRGLRKELCILMPATNSTQKQVRCAEAGDGSIPNTLW